MVKELSFCHKLWFSNFNIVATQFRRLLVFQTMKAIRSNNVSLKYQRFTSSGCKEIRLIKVSLWQKLNSFHADFQNFTKDENFYGGKFFILTIQIPFLGPCEFFISTFNSFSICVRIFFVQRNWVSATNSDILTPISLQPDVVDLWYFKLWFLLYQIV